MASPYLPRLLPIQEVRPETPDVLTFRFAEDLGHRPGQFVMCSLLGVGEAPFSVSSSPTRSGFELSVRRVGRLTAALHRLEPGHRVGIRGPYGNGFPLERLEGRGLVFVAGGIGLAPLRSLLVYALDRREAFGPITLIYGARSPQDLCFKEELREWEARGDLRVVTTVDRPFEGWEGRVGLVPAVLEEEAPEAEGAVAIVCGPPVMIRFTLPVLRRLGFGPDRIVTTLERRMRCGVGKCGRCNLGPLYVCREGPVFTLEQLESLPPEL